VPGKRAVVASEIELDRSGTKLEDQTSLLRFLGSVLLDILRRPGCRLVRGISLLSNSARCRLVTE